MSEKDKRALEAKIRAEARVRDRRSSSSSSKSPPPSASKTTMTSSIITVRSVSPGDEVAAKRVSSQVKVVLSPTSKEESFSAATFSATEVEKEKKSKGVTVTVQSVARGGGGVAGGGGGGAKK